MKNSLIKNSLLLLSIVTSFFFTACVRERDTETETESELAFNEFVYKDAASIADDAATKNTGDNLSNYKTQGYCATITHDITSSPHTIVIDFDTINCMCNDSRNRRGKILVTYTGNYNDSASVHIITFDKYFVNDHLIMGTFTSTNRGHNTSGQTFYDLVTDAKVLKPLALDTIYYNSKETQTWIQGETTPVWEDDVYETIGNGTGKNASRLFYSMNIVAPLQKGVACRYINKGKIEVQNQGKALRAIDFGDGNCDDDATVTLNTKQFAIKL